MSKETEKLNDLIDTMAAIHKALRNIGGYTDENIVPVMQAVILGQSIQNGLEKLGKELVKRV